MLSQGFLRSCKGCFSSPSKKNSLTFYKGNMVRARARTRNSRNHWILKRGPVGPVGLIAQLLRVLRSCSSVTEKKPVFFLSSFFLFPRPQLLKLCTQLRQCVFPLLKSHGNGRGQAQNLGQTFKGRLKYGWPKLKKIETD